VFPNVIAQAGGGAGGLLLRADRLEPITYSSAEAYFADTKQPKLIACWLTFDSETCRGWAKGTEFTIFRERILAGRFWKVCNEI
jgi:hypothetical protein